MSEPNGNGPLRDPILSYWNEAKLASINSSTSHADYDWADFDNAVENMTLRRILAESLSDDAESVLDIGAGYGRFAPTLLEMFGTVVLLEAAPSIFEVLHSRWASHPRIACVNTPFDEFDSAVDYDALLASGLLYLYSDEQVHRFVARCVELLRPAGLLVVRDFLSRKGYSHPSAYVAGASCRYRPLSYWHSVASAHQMELGKVVIPCLGPGFLRNPRVQRIWQLFGGRHVLKSERLRIWAASASATRIPGRPATAIMVMRKKAR